MQCWTETSVLALASRNCQTCTGLGHVARVVCPCVFLAVFKDCHDRFRECAAMPGRLNLPTWDRNPGKTNARIWGHKNLEYVADFAAVARHALGEGTLEHRVFKAHYLLGADCPLVCRQLGIDVDTFHAICDSIRYRLGRALRETEPFALHPVSEYFSSGYRHAEPTPAAA